MAWPTTDDPRTRFATLRMTADEDDDLDWACRSRGVSRSEFLRTASANEIARERKAHKARQKKQSAKEEGA